MSTAKIQEIGSPYSKGLNFDIIQDHDLENNESIKSRIPGLYSANYGDYCKLYLANMNLVAKVKFLNNDNHFLRTKIDRIEQRQIAAEKEETYKSVCKTPQKEERKIVDAEEQSARSDNGLKRKRKKKTEVERAYICSFPTCGKGYGSENSLNQHIKFKHYDYWVSQRKFDNDKLDKKEIIE